MEEDVLVKEHGRLYLESLVCKLGLKKWAGLAIQAPRSHVLPIDGVAMDLVVCLDRSKSMGRYWPIVLETLRKGISKLTGRDRLGIRTFAGQRHSQSVFPMTRMDQEGQLKALEAIKKIANPSSGHTNLGAALEEGLEELIQNYENDPSEPERAVRLLLYTDGKPTVGVKELEKLVEIRNQQLSKLGPSAKVAVFAYGERHAVKILKSICSDHSSLYFAVTDQNIVSCLGEFYGGTRTTFFRDLVLYVDCPRESELQTSFAHKLLAPNYDTRKWEVHIPDMQSSERRNIILKIPASVRSGKVKWTLQYYSVVARQTLTDTRQMDIVKDVTNDNKAQINLDEQRNRITSINALQKALAQAAIKDWSEARQTISRQRRRIAHSISRNAPLSRQLSKQLDRYRVTFRRRAQDIAAGRRPYDAPFREEAEMSAFCQALEVERSSSACIEKFQTLEKRAQTEVLREELEPTLTIRRNRAAQRRAIAREKRRANLESSSSTERTLIDSLDNSAPPPTGFGLNSFIKQQQRTREQQGRDRVNRIAPVLLTNINSTAEEARDPAPPMPSQAPRITHKRSLSSDFLTAYGPSAPPLTANSYLALAPAPAPVSTAPSAQSVPDTAPSAPPLTPVGSAIAATPNTTNASTNNDEMTTTTTATRPSPRDTTGHAEAEAESSANGITLSGRSLSLRAVALSARRSNVTVRKKSSTADDIKRKIRESKEAEEERRSLSSSEREPNTDRPLDASEVVANVSSSSSSMPVPILDLSSEVPLSTPVIIAEAAPTSQVQQVQPLPISPYASPLAEPGRSMSPSEFVLTLKQQQQERLPDQEEKSTSTPVSSASSSGTMYQRSARDGLKKRILQLQQRRGREPIDADEGNFSVLKRNTTADMLLKKQQKDEEAKQRLDDEEGLKNDEEDAFDDSIHHLAHADEPDQALIDATIHELLHFHAQDSNSHASPFNSPNRSHLIEESDGSDEYSDDEPANEAEGGHEWSYSGSSDEEEESDDDDEDDERSNDAGHPSHANDEDDDGSSEDEDEEEPEDKVRMNNTVSALRRRASKRWSHSADDHATRSRENKDDEDDDGEEGMNGSQEAVHPLRALKKFAADPQFRPRKLFRPQQFPKQKKPAPPPSLIASADSRILPPSSSSSSRPPSLPGRLAFSAVSPVRQSPFQDMKEEDSSDEDEEDSDEDDDNSDDGTVPLHRVPPYLAAIAKQLGDLSLYKSRTSFTFSAPSYIEPVPPDEEDQPHQEEHEEDDGSRGKLRQAEEQQAMEESGIDERNDDGVEDEPPPPRSGRGSFSSNSGTTSRSGSFSSSPAVPHRHPPPPQQQAAPPLPSSSSFDVRQLIVQLDEASSSSAARKEALITLRSASTTLAQLMAKIEQKFPPSSSSFSSSSGMMKVSVLMGSTADGSASAAARLIPIETDDDVEDLIHGNILRVRFE